jgi:Protein of unknown function (DUF3617)
MRRRHPSATNEITTQRRGSGFETRDGKTVGSLLQPQTGSLMNRTAATLAFALLLDGAALAQTSRPGLYSYSVQVQAMGVSWPETIFQQCLTQRDIEAGQVRHVSRAFDDCSVPSISRSGDRFKVSVSCAQPPMTFTGAGVSTPDRFEMDGTVSMTGPIRMDQKHHVSARRVGDCRG